MAAPASAQAHTLPFTLAAPAVRQLAPPALPRSFLREFLLDGRTPARAMTDEAMRTLLPALEGAGRIIELGAGGDYYKAYASPGQAYLTSNLVPGGDLVLDMTRLDLADDSIEALVSVFALEHVYDYAQSIREQCRVLAPGGRMLLVVPFLYYYHAAPDDYFRFTASALDHLLAPTEVLVRQPIGGRWLLFAEFLHEKKVMGSQLGFAARLALRLLALPFLAAGLREHDARHAMAFAYLCQKPPAP